jgi:hypothetical protein
MNIAQIELTTSPQHSEDRARYEGVKVKEERLKYEDTK